MKFGLASKLRKAFAPGAFRTKVLPYLAYYSGLGVAFAGLFRRLPLKRDKIVFNNFRGFGFGDHQKYIVLELLRRGVAADIVWLAEDVEKVRREVPEGVRVVPYSSVAALRELSTARLWCVNQSMNHFIFRGLRKRRGQIYLQTYHGSLGIKRIGGDRAGNGEVRLWEGPLRRDAAMIDYLVANAVWEAEAVYRTRFYGCGEIKLFGHPRNDVFFRNGDREREKVRRTFGLTDAERLAFYAPTHRSDHSPSTYLHDAEGLRSAFERRFGGRWRVMVRLHPNMRPYFHEAAMPGAVDATDYPDMQELLIAADALISDFSSCMFDFMLTRRPVFVFAAARENYERIQGFYYPLSETPFPIAEDEAELRNNIAAFDDAAYRAKVEAFLAEKGCVEDGRATGRVCDLIEEALG